MKHFQIHIIVLALSWTQASDLKSRHTATEEQNAQLQLNPFINKHTHFQSNANVSRSGNTHKPQNDQNTVSSRTPARRALKGNRPMPKRTSSVTENIPAGLTLKSAPSEISNSTGSINPLAGFAGKNRVLVISAPNNSDGYYRLMMTLLKPDVYCEMAERHMQQIVMFHGKEERGGKVRRVSNQGSVVEESLDPSHVPRIMALLKLEEGKFGMVLLRKTLKIEERYPYPVQLEAIYEVIDQTGMRRLEKARQKGFVQKCKAAGVEGKVVQSFGSNTQVDTVKTNRTKMVRPVAQPTVTAQVLIPSTIITTTTTKRKITTTLKTTTTRTPTTTSTATSAATNFPSTTTAVTTNIPSTLKQKDPSHKLLPKKHQSTTIQPATTTDAYTHHTENTFTSSTQPYRQKPKNKQTGLKIGLKEKLSPHEHDTHRPAIIKPKEDLTTVQKGKTKADDADRKKKAGNSEKPLKKLPAGKKGPKETKVGLQNNKSGHKPKVNEERAVLSQPANSKKSLETFLGYFERRRRLIVITTPDEQNHMYSEQRDEYLEQVCNMALRKISIITIFGSITNSTMKIDHYQTEHDEPLHGLPDSDLINQRLITTFRKEFGMTHSDFNMALTDFDMKVMQRYEVPIVMKAVFDYIDTLSTRIKEIEQQKKLGVVCNKDDKSRSLENFLSRFRWRRRLFVISSPSDEEWAFQQQLYTINSHACHLGLRHVSVLKLVGRSLNDIRGFLDLYPINGSASVDREELSASLVQDIRNYFQISQDYFSMLLVGKDGNVKSWYPSPLWSMSIIYDLIDSMQLRRQEMAIQHSLSMRCPDDDYSHHDGYHEGYHGEHGY